MRNKAAQIKERLLSDDKMVFYIVSIVFAFIFSFANVAADDVGGTQLIDHSFSGYYETVMMRYQNWMSRVFVFASVLFFRNNPTIYWAVFMGISIFVMMEAISLLFVKKNVRVCNNFIACMVMLFPFSVLNSAGWISTMTTYFSPTAFGLLSLVPIKKLASGEKFKWWEYVLYAVATLYSSNNEQVLVVVLGCYGVATVYFACMKKVYLFELLLLLLAIFNAVITMMCPGNAIRRVQEMPKWYAEYEMLDMIDKAEIGYTSAIHWLLYSGHVFVIVICVILTIMVWKKYTDTRIRTLTVIPAAITILAGPLNSITSTMFPSLWILTADISKYGLVTAENRGNMAIFMQFFVMSLVVLLVALEVYLLLDSFKEMLVCFTLLLTGLASRVALGFSPTIWASGYRTCEVMSFCIISFFCFVYIKNVDKGLLSEKLQKRIMYILNGGMILAFINLWQLVAVSFL